MATIFDAIADDFLDDLEAIRNLVETFDSTFPPKTRIISANAAVLLLAAIFEEFVRTMAREYARSVVESSRSITDLPSELPVTAWKRTMDALGKIKFEPSQQERINIFSAAQIQFSKVHEFCKGDLSQDIYDSLIHNEMNMRPSQINSLFKLSGLKDICYKCSDKQIMLETFAETEVNKTHGKFLQSMEQFFEKRNEIAHALNLNSSSSPSQIIEYIKILDSFSKAIKETLNKNIAEIKNKNSIELNLT